MRLEECFNRGLLRKAKVSEDIITKELHNAYRHLENATKCLDEGMYDLAVVSVYTAMFHASRAILFRDGIKERSHICVVEYLRVKYPDLGEYITVLDNYRQSRHTMLYGIDVDILLEDAEEGIKSAMSFIEKVETIIGSAQTQYEKKGEGE